MISKNTLVIFMAIIRIPMGTLKVGDHNSETISGALTVPDNRFDDIFREVSGIYEEITKISMMIEQCTQRFKGSELALALMILGIVHERARPEEE